MILRGLILCLCTAVVFGHAATAASPQSQARSRHEPTIECAAKGGECDESRGRPVCGTDDQTYPTRCHLLRVQCSGHQVSLKYRGPCKACKEARDYALKHKTARHPPKFIPRCKPDGTYAPIQCLGDTGCWCSDIAGKPIENTSVRTGKPKCRVYQRANIRRSPAPHISPGRLVRRPCTQPDRAAFNANLLKVFHSEYMRSGQHQRDISAGVDGAGGIGGGIGGGLGGGTGASAGFVPPADKLVLDWKFAHLDVNANRMLDKGEFRELKKLVKQAVKPRRCGRAFGKFCDVDNDDRLSRLEWNNCISKDGINRHHHANGANHSHKFNTINNNLSNGHSKTNSNTNSNTNTNNNQNSNNNHSDRHNIYTNHLHHQTHPSHLNSNSNSNSNSNRNSHHNRNSNNNRQNKFDGSVGVGVGIDDEDDDEEVDESSQQHIDYDEEANDYADEGDDEDDSISMIHTFGSSTNLPSYILRPKPDSPLKESEGESDCLADQAAALENGDTLLYVPECTPDGRYQRVQCYRSTPYCWCVHEDTGKNIPGTSVKDKRPQCDNIYPATRPMKGCPEPKKAVFLKDLKQFLQTHFLANTNTGANTTNWNSEDERIATLSFVLLDKNKNKSWERKEWKTFRELVTNSKTLRKCGKKMPRYCDVNSDKKITLSEWLNCLQTQRAAAPPAPPQASTQSNESVTSKPSKLIGSNPLEQYLKD